MYGVYGAWETFCNYVIFANESTSFT